MGATVIGEIKIRLYMLHNVTDHIDPLTGEVNATSLAEDAFWHFEPNNDAEIPEKYFDCSADIANQTEATTTNNS